MKVTYSISTNHEVLYDSKYGGGARGGDTLNHGVLTFDKEEDAEKCFSAILDEIYDVVREEIEDSGLECEGLPPAGFNREVLDDDISSHRDLYFKDDWDDDGPDYGKVFWVWSYSRGGYTFCFYRATESYMNKYGERLFPKYTVTLARNLIFESFEECERYYDAFNAWYDDDDSEAYDVLHEMDPDFNY